MEYEIVYNNTILYTHEKRIPHHKEGKISNSLCLCVVHLTHSIFHPHAFNATQCICVRYTHIDAHTNTHSLTHAICCGVVKHTSRRYTNSSVILPVEWWKFELKRKKVVFPCTCTPHHTQKNRHARAHSFTHTIAEVEYFVDRVIGVKENYKSYVHR